VDGLTGNRAAATDRDDLTHLRSVAEVHAPQLIQL
jgi:hypothetical protein